MKKFLVLVLALLFVTSSFAQSDWAPIGAKWYYNTYYGAPEFLVMIESIGDTIINSQPCRILKTYEINAEMDSIGSYHWDSLFCPLQFTYQDSGIVYLYDNEKNDFNVLYNFNATNGDTITVVDTAFSGYCPDAIPCNKFQYVIDSTTNTVISGISLHKQFVSPTQNSGWVITTVSPSGPTGNYPIIESIGATKYLFGVFVNQAMEGSVKDLRCYEDGIVSFHLDWLDSLSCGYLPDLSITESADLKHSINIFPNPTDGISTIETLGKTTIEIFNIQGQVIEAIQSEGKETTLDLSILPGGVYLIKVKTDKGVVTKKLIKE